MLSHQHIVDKINLAAQHERENKDIEEMERESAPLFYAMFAVAFAVSFWTATEDYRKYYEAESENKVLSEIVARCANGQYVAFDGYLLKCKTSKVEVVR